jgi:hypothetical protein
MRSREDVVRLRNANSVTSATDDLSCADVIRNAQVGVRQTVSDDLPDDPEQTESVVPYGCVGPSVPASSGDN